jgi:hypothetical protein
MQAKHIKETISLCAALVAGVALVAASGAGAAKAPRTVRIDVSTKSAVVHYLRSIHVNPKGVVIQRGARNYAGPNCPGKRWTCASTKHTVVQIAKRGGRNRFVCKSSKCVVVQISGASQGVYASGGRWLASTAAPNKGGGNSGVCVKTGSGATTGGGQTCTISQVGSGPNTAVIYENTQKVSGLTQTAQYTATITQQSSGSAANTACVTQNINLDGSTANTNGKPMTVNLQAFQTVTITQDSPAGNNAAQNAATSTGTCDMTSTALAQSQTLTSTVSATASITQNQDTALTNPQGVPAANVVIRIDQNQGSAFKGFASGLNNAAFTQTTNQVAIANTTKGTVTQQQNANVPNPPYSGSVGTINQDSSAKSTASATQTETQCEDAANTSISAPLTQCSTTSDGPVPGITLNQTQYGPEGVFTPATKSAGRVPFFHKGYGESQQTGAGPGVHDKFTLQQTSTQSTDAGGKQSNTIQGDCSSSGDSSSTGGSCEAIQQATLNNGTTQAGWTAPNIPDVHIKCEPNQTCSATPPPAPEITGTPDAQTESTSATFTWTEAATAGVTLKCSIDGGTTFTTCDSPTSTSYTGLSHGPHTFEVKAVDNTASHNESAADSFTWEIIPYLTFETTDDGAAAGWSGTPGLSPITLTTGSDPGTYAQFTIHDSNSLLVDDLAEPTFTTDTFSGGAPRYEIDFSDGDYAFGYPSQQGWGTASWDLNCGQISCVPMSNVTWSAIQGAETGQTVTDALIEADFPANATYNVTDFTFDGYSLSFFTD